MKVIYLSSYTFPSTRAEQYYIKSMAQSFFSMLGHDFQLVIRGDVPADLTELGTIGVRTPKRLRSLFYLCWFPYFLLRSRLNTQATVFMSNDPYLLAIFIFWRTLGRFRYSVCSDWHQLFDDWRDAFVGKHSDVLIATSLRLKTLMIPACQVIPEKILVAYGGINPELFRKALSMDKGAIRKDLGLPLDTFLVGYVGGFRSVGLEKGLDTMIHALTQLTEKNITMVFVGGTKQYIEEYTALARQVGVAEQCIFIEKQQFAQVVLYEVAMDALVIPYPDKHHFRDYGFPMKVWEYMASGNPIIYSNLEIIGEILQGRATAFQPEDAVSLARVISTIYNNGDVEKETAVRNLKEILLYTWDARVGQIIDAIKKSFQTRNAL